MTGRTTRARVAKRKAGELDVDEIEGREQSPSVIEIEENSQQDEEYQPRETPSATRLEADILSLSASGAVNHRQKSRKRQKVEAPLTESEYTEIEYVNQMRQNFAPKNGLAGDLPPIHDLDQIFEQITLHAAQKNAFGEFIKSLNGRKLRVATVCSGTESPILALEMIVSNLEKLGIESFAFEHLFSAEIVEYKQAYIERNFRPPILFRDVTELHQKTAHTAYGAKCEVPTRPDLLVAGFPCVDYSNLNNWRKELGQRGESSDTLRGIVAYCEVHRPRIVILENISNAPWPHIGTAFEKAGYYFRSVKVDTKDFYLPQTRERGYALCIAKSIVKNGNKLLDEWASIFFGFQRRASSPFTDFIDADDDVIEQRKLERAASSEPRSSPNWSLYKIRHADVRRGTTFGNGRPITHWVEGGKCCPATWMDRPWFFSQVERVWDTIDVSHLRSLATLGYDNSYKVRCIDVSQGVDRDVDTRPFGVIGCITPSGMLYSTARGGLIQGRELLAMQGIPLRRLSLTKESQAQMQDLAGNAMSTTVVGPTVIAALIACRSIFSDEHGVSNTFDADTLPDQEVPAQSLIESLELSMRGFTVQWKTSTDWLAKIKALAGLTSSLCSCEGQYGIGRHGLYRCINCKFTACAACKVNPVHNYKPIPVSQLRARRNPKIFQELLLWTLPSTMQPPKLPMHIYQTMSDEYASSQETQKICRQFLKIIERVNLDILLFASVKRTHIWTVMYEGPHSILRLTVGPWEMHWNLFAKAPPDEPSQSYLREILRHPIARIEVPEYGLSILEGIWQVCKPLSKKEKTVVLQGAGELLPSYEAVCGLPGSAQDQRVWSSVIVSASDEAMEGLPIDVRGKYERIADCGGALQSLHRRTSVSNEPHLFFFLDSRRLGPSQLDSWVFSTNPRRRNNDLEENIILQLDSNWEYRQLLSSGASSVLASYRHWISVGAMSFANYDSQLAINSRIPRQNWALQINDLTCYNCYIPLLSVATHAFAGISIPCKQGPWQPVEISNLAEIEKFAWMWTRFMNLSPSKSWTTINTNFQICRRCSPKNPRMAWTVIRNRERPIEDPIDAARCERDYKSRPSSFCLFTKIEKSPSTDGKETVHVCFALNIKTMFHRACGTIAHRHDANTPVNFYWRITCNDDTDIPRPGSFRVLNNNTELEAAHPPHFRITLRSDQLRSLQWVLTRESENMAAFPEEEVDETILGPLNWRAEAKVIVHRKIKGGILADQVGFGKTAVVLGLIDCQHEKDILESTESCDNAIPLKATCIVIPDILFAQWRSEILKFLGAHYTVLEIEDIAKMTATTMKAFQSADIVLVSWTALTGPLYFARLEEIAGGPSPPIANSNVRMFEAWFDDVLGSIEDQVNVLKSSGPEGFIEANYRRRSTIWGTDAYNRYLPSRRLRGKKAATSDTTADAHAMDPAGDVAPESSINQQIPQRMLSSARGTKNITRGSTQMEMTSNCESKQERLRFRTMFGISENKQTSLEELKGTVLHMYRFQRVVVDEFTYLNQDRHTLLVSLKARSRWIMSGTPPIRGFPAAERMARLINVYLGKPGDEEYEKSKYKRSESENFHFFREIASRGWHFRRNGLAQRFLDVFMRQNTPEIPRIQWNDHYCPIVLTAVERVLYLELKLFFESYNPQTKIEKRGKFVHDQRGRVSEMVDTCDTPEKSLIKRSSSYESLPPWSSAKDSIDTMIKLIRQRRKELNDLICEITRQSKAISWLFHQLGLNDHRFDALRVSILSNDHGDADISITARQIIDHALETYQEEDWKLFWCPPNHRPVHKVNISTNVDENETGDNEHINDKEELVGTTDESRSQSRRKNDVSQCGRPTLKPLPNNESDKEKELREWTNKVRTNILALVERMRALRFAESGYAFQDTSTAPDCHSCGRGYQHCSEQHSILGKCGHIICVSCLEDALSARRCSIHGCHAIVDKQYVISGSFFRMCRSVDKATPLGGSKMRALIKLLKDTNAISAEDQVILFLQFPDLQGAITAAFDMHNISYVSMGMSGQRGRSKIKAFAEHNKKVAILQLGTENAAGLNLQNANHVIYFAPFAAKNYYEYQSTVTQSSGRVIRFGQKKEVHIWNLVTLNTLEVGVLQGQAGRVLVRHPEGRYDLVLEDEVEPNDTKGFEVPVFEWR